MSPYLLLCANSDHSLKYENNSYCCVPPFCFDSQLIKCQTEKKTVPLERITDLTFSQSFFQRYFGVDQIAVQTASSQGKKAVSPTSHQSHS